MLYMKEIKKQKRMKFLVEGRLKAQIKKHIHAEFLRDGRRRKTTSQGPALQKCGQDRQIQLIEGPAAFFNLGHKAGGGWKAVSAKMPKYRGCSRKSGTVLENRLVAPPLPAP